MNKEKIKIVYEWFLVIICFAFILFWIIYFFPAIGNWWNENNIEEVATGQYIGH